MQSLLKRAAVVATTTGAIIAATATPALAVRGDACGRGVCGSATWSWAASNKMINLSLNVKDTACDNNDVYIQLREYYTSSGSYDIVWRRRNSLGCNASRTWSDLTNTNYRGIHGIRVEVCVNDFGNDTCYLSSTYQKNPYW